MERSTVRLLGPLNQPHLLLGFFEGTPMPMSLHVVVAQPNLRSLDFVSSTFICFLSILSFLAIYLSLWVYSSLLALRTLCSLWILIS